MSAFPADIFCGKKVRDVSGNLAETWTKRGDRIEIRNKDNNLTRGRKRVDEGIDVRDGHGNLIREESGEHMTNRITLVRPVLTAIDVSAEEKSTLLNP